MVWIGGDLKDQLQISVFSPPSILCGHRNDMAREKSLLLWRGDTQVRCPSCLCKSSEVMLHLHNAQGWMSMKGEGECAFTAQEREEKLAQGSLPPQTPWVETWSLSNLSHKTPWHKLAGLFTFLTYSLPSFLTPVKAQESQETALPLL